MKKIIFTFAVFSFFVFASSSFAAVDICTNLAGDQTMAPVGYIHNSDDTCTIAPSNGNPLIVMQAWGLNGYETKTVPPGTVITDDAGSSYTCNIRTDSQGCSVLVGLDYYRNQMRVMYKSLVALGIAYQFPQFSYWK